MVIVHPFDLLKWKMLFAKESECIVHQVIYPDYIIFYPYFNTENQTMYTDTVAVFKVKKKLTNTMIADEIINNACKNLVNF